MHWQRNVEEAVVVVVVVMTTAYTKLLLRLV
jgi:hypothetical protein